MRRPSVKELAIAIREMIDSGEDEKKLIANVAQYLVEERRSGDLEHIMRELERIRLETDHILEVTAVSAYPLEADSKKIIKSIFANGYTIIIERLDESLVGGANVEASDKQVDASISGKLNKFRNYNRMKV